MLDCLSWMKHHLLRWHDYEMDEQVQDFMIISCQSREELILFARLFTTWTCKRRTALFLSRLYSMALSELLALITLQQRFAKYFSYGCKESFVIVNWPWKMLKHLTPLLQRHMLRLCRFFNKDKDAINASVFTIIWIEHMPKVLQTVYHHSINIKGANLTRRFDVEENIRYNLMTLSP